MANYRNLDVLDAAEQVAGEINQLIDVSPRLLHIPQLRDSSQAVPANIAEGFGRDTYADRNKFLRTARGSAERTIQHLRSNYHANRIPRSNFWRLNNRLVTISKMIDSLLNSPSHPPP